MKAYVKPSCSFVELRTEESLANSGSTGSSLVTLTQNWKNNLGHTWDNLNELFKNKS